MVKLLGELVAPAARKSRIEIADLFAAYVAECKTLGVAVANGETFGARAKAFAKAAGIRVCPATASSVDAACSSAATLPQQRNGSDEAG